MNNKIKFNQLSSYGCSCYLFTDFKKIINLNQALKKLPRGVKIILREYDFEKEKRAELVAKLLLKNQLHHHKILIGKDLKLAQKFRAHGMHFSDNDLVKKSNYNFLKNYNLWQVRSFCKRKKITFSLALHNLKFLNYIKKLQPDIIFLSPVFPSTSHPQQANIGFFQYIKMVKIIVKKTSSYYHKNIAPLGGVNLYNLRRLNKFGITQFGAIDFFNNL